MKTTPSPLRLAMLGTWHTHADGLFRQIAAHPDEFQFLGCYDSQPEVVQTRRQVWQSLVPEFRVFESVSDLLNQPLEGVIVDGRVHDNIALAQAAIEAGFPVLLEKPAGCELARYQALQESARQRGLHVQMLYLFRYMSAIEELRTRAARGELGRIYSFRARLPKELATYDRFREELRPYGGGIFFEMAGHVIDLMVDLLGRPRRIVPLLAHHHDDPDNTYMDHGLAVFEFDRAFGTIEVPAMEIAPQSRRIEVYGSEGACVIPHLGSGHLKNDEIQPIEICRAGDTEWQRIDLPAARLHIRDLREFAAVIRGMKAPDFDFDHDLAVQESLLIASGIMDSPQARGAPGPH